MSTSAPKRRVFLYLLLNAGFIVTVCVLASIGGAPSPRFLHLILLFALCSSSVIDLDGLNGRYALLGIFQCVYFVSYGVGDFTDLWTGKSSEDSNTVFSATEAVVLAGGIALTLAYRIAIALGRGVGRRSPPRDWPLHWVLMVAIATWAIGTFATYWWNVHIVTDTTIEAAKRGISSLSSLTVSAFILGQMMQPLGILLFAYAWRSSAKPHLLPVIIAIVGLQVILGFVIDIKGIAMIGGILVILTCVLIDGRIPKVWLAAAVAFVIFGFPIFQAYRTEVHGNRGTARTTVVENLAKALDTALSAKERVNTGKGRAQTFLERSSVRGSLQMIVVGVGNGVDFQRGYTLTPLLTAFLPRIIWSDKPEIPTGQIVNKVFHVSEVPDVYISPSHLGELYWNFGWPGAVLGMGLIGGLLGFISSRFNLAENRTVTALLVVMLTIKQLILGFEGAIAPDYVVWLRSMAGVGVLHLLFARVPVRTEGSPAARKALRPDTAGRIESAGPFPNLLH